MKGSTNQKLFFADSDTDPGGASTLDPNCNYTLAQTVHWHGSRGASQYLSDPNCRCKLWELNLEPQAFVTLFPSFGLIFTRKFYQMTLNDMAFKI